MSYPVRLIGGTDELRLTDDGHAYHIGDVIPRLSDEQRLDLQRNGIRFAAVHDDDPPVFPETEAVQVPPDQAALNQEIEQARAKPAATKKEA